MNQFEFHISRKARQRYQFDQAIFGLNGNVVFADFQAARAFAHKMNALRPPEEAVQAGQINALGLIDEILHLMARQYRLQANPQALEKALKWLEAHLGAETVADALNQFCQDFPPTPVYRGEMSIDDYLETRTDGLPNREISLEEMLMLWLANANPAFEPYLELFDDTELEERSAYRQIIAELENFFETQPRFGPSQESLFKLLRAPSLSANTLEAQLDYLRKHWAPILGDHIQTLLRGLDFIKEERKAPFLGPGPAKVPDYPSYELVEEERFSPDSDWMPRVVLVAKNAFVWLDQLSKQYQRDIQRLDQIPDEELDRLARWGFTGLWLIGLWERSPASQRIKQLCGNPDAVASAYSLYDYTISSKLGGEEAYQTLRQRAKQRGVRLAADMVPNHVGIYSKWVIEHPDWFIALDHAPFPKYSFTGENLSHDERVGIYIEDGYYAQSDAAVVFKRVDRWTGDTKYIYHGNDGTAMPWNDTAQLDYLKEEVRQAAIETILHVARKFSIIRFDAAMTLAKKHFQRLWFPPPGSGGDIPSRAEHGMTREQFDQAMPEEFWRQVVDRVAEEAPDTLLLAEAFWMMEGYFVRTLGMHRVYNSAFMNMLRDEKNDQYRLLIKNTLQFDPQILKRYVNFMNNPDEETAIDQFGDGGKYFGVCTMMATLPGLPMFGHGQVEGLHEKYGMEYKRAYWDETPDSNLVNRHEREIAPLLHRRAQFAEVDHFYLYDFYKPERYVDENVFAYSNRFHGQRSLVIYHNKWAETRGWIKRSAAFLDKSNQEQRQVDLAEGLDLQSGEQTFTIFRDQITGLEYIRSNRELHENGLYLELGAYEYRVLLDFRQVEDNQSRQYVQLCDYLEGRGVPSIEEALQERLLQPLHHSFSELANAETSAWLLEDLPSPAAAGEEIEQKATRLFEQIESLLDEDIQRDELAEEIIRKLNVILPLIEKLARKQETLNPLEAWLLLPETETLFWSVLLAWLFSHNLGKAITPEDEDTDWAKRSARWYRDWLLGNVVSRALSALDIDDAYAQGGALAVEALIEHQRWYQQSLDRGELLANWLEGKAIQRLLRFNRYDGVLWLHKESFALLLRWMLAVAIINAQTDEQLSKTRRKKMLERCFEIAKSLEADAEQAGYQVEKLIDTAKA